MGIKTKVLANGVTIGWFDDEPDTEDDLRFKAEQEKFARKMWEDLQRREAAGTHFSTEPKTAN